MLDCFEGNIEKASNRQKAHRSIPRNIDTIFIGKSEWADYAAEQAKCGNLSGNELTSNSSGNTWPQLFQLAEPLWTDPGLKSGIIFTF